MVGVKCAVHGPKPKGAGSALANAASARRSAASTAKRWNSNHLRCVCITHFGSPVVPDVELSIQSSSDASARSGATAVVANGRPRGVAPLPCRSGAFEEGGDCALAGAGADADGHETGPLAADVRRVHVGTV